MKRLKDWGGNRSDFIVNAVSQEGHVDNILDIGCAHGSGLNALRGKATTLIGIDMDEDAILRGQNDYSHLELIHQSARELPFESEYFDIVILAEVIEHVGDKNKQIVIDEAHRVLKSGGLFILTCPYAGLLDWTDPMDFKRRFPKLYRIYMQRSGYTPHTPMEIGHKHLSIKELKTLFASRFDFEIVRYCGSLTPLFTAILSVDSRLKWLPTRVHQAMNRWRGWESGLPTISPLAFNIRLTARKKAPK